MNTKRDSQEIEPESPTNLTSEFNLIHKSSVINSSLAVKSLREIKKQSRR